MSFAGTPLGQGRRLDHSTFLGKPSSSNNNNRPPSPHRLIPTSYAYGAPILGSRSPPKHTSPTRERSKQQLATDRTDDGPRRNQPLNLRPGGPKIITSPPHPEKWSVKDTSVNIASAFYQAIETNMQPSHNPHSQAWASSSRPNSTAVPRSTSVEFEQEAQSMVQRRLPGPPPSRSSASRSIRGAKPLSKNLSSKHVPDSEGEEDSTTTVTQNGRGKSPFEHLADAGTRALSAATYYVRRRSREPEDGNSITAKDNSYDYSAEERDYKASQSASGRKIAANHKRGRISTDNKAYKPPVSEDEASDEDWDDDDKTRRRKKKKKRDSVGGPLTSLPVISQDKRKKKKGKKGNAAAGEEEEEEEESENDDASQRRSEGRGSVTSRQSAARQSIARDPQASYDSSLEQGLGSIPEIPEEEFGDLSEEMERRKGSFLSAILGRLVYYAGRCLGLFVRVGVKGVSALLFIFGRILGTVAEIAVMRPLRWLQGPSAGPVFTYIFLASLAIPMLWYILQNPQLLPTFPSREPYTSPGLPAADLTELNTRLLKIESALQALSVDSEKTKVRTDNEAKNNVEVVARLGALEGRVQKESSRAVDAEAQVRDATNKGLEAVKREMEALHAQIEAAARQSSGSGSGPVEVSGSDEEARARLKTLEDRVGSVEGGVKEALELGKNSVKAGGSDVAWWNKLGTGKKGITIKSSDGQDVTALIGHLVDSAVSMYGKDVLARPDLALYSGGGRVIPSLTSDTLEIRPSGFSLWGSITGSGTALGRPPVTALHHELHNGYCWPFAGSEGHLGVLLAAPARITDITIDHVASEVAFDLRSAPRQMEVWGVVDGAENTAKIEQWRAEKAAKRAEALERGEEVEEEPVPPKTFSTTRNYARIATFSYSIHSPNNIQTFPVSEDIRELGVDFGVVVLRVLNNWGRDEFTCLYRLRVHGARVTETPPPLSEE